MTQTPTEQERPLRVCDVCFQVDDHPRHQIAHPIGAVPADYEGLKQVLRNVDAQTDAKRACRGRLPRHLDAAASHGLLAAARAALTVPATQ
jgi:hypothetical protein